LPPAELTLIANVALDRVNGGPWTRGGCPTWAPYAFAHLQACGVIDTACAPADVSMFRALEADDWVSVHFTTASATTRFDLDYSGEFGDTRSMVVHSVGHTWSSDDIDRLGIDTEWVHLAPLLRSDFPAAAVRRLAALGHRVAYDGQGLVRVPQVGALTFDARYDPGLLRHLTVLKLSEDEIAVLSAEHGYDAVLDALSAVPELLLTQGSRGAEVRTGGSRTHVAPDRAISNVHTTGAGDAFLTAYLIGRARDLSPAAAASLGANVAAAMLAERKGRRSGQPAGPAS
jgi:sugar/nucleoside kinase (ribokinase family)